MVWVIILAWIAVVVVLVVALLRLAQGESQDHIVTRAKARRNQWWSDKDSHASASSDQQMPRRAGSALAYTPQTPAVQLRRARPYEDNEDTMDHPVYVNDSSVVEVKALMTPSPTDSDETSDKTADSQLSQTVQTGELAAETSDQIPRTPAS